MTRKLPDLRRSDPCAAAKKESLGGVDGEGNCAEVSISTVSGADPAVSAESQFKIRVP